MDGYSYLTFDQRRKIEALYSDGERAVDSPFEVLGISADEVKSIKGVLKNYALSDK